MASLIAKAATDGLLPLTIGQKTGALTKIPPLFNLTVSNVVLTKDPLYLGGAQLELIAPVSFLCDGYGLGVRFDFPSFPIQLDYAWPINTDETLSDSGRFSFSIGYTY